MAYILDSNTFIEAKNRYYGMNVCPGFWDWLLLSNTHGHLYSIEMVKKELEKGNDDLNQWAKNNSQLFVKESDLETQNSYGEIAAYAMSLENLNAGAQEEFLRVADSWLIAKAKSTGSTLVTHEQLNPNTKKKILMPNVCEEFGIKWMNTFDCLEELEAKFVLAPS